MVHLRIRSTVCLVLNEVLVVTGHKGCGIPCCGAGMLLEGSVILEKTDLLLVFSKHGLPLCVRTFGAVRRRPVIRLGTGGCNQLVCSRSFLRVLGMTPDIVVLCGGLSSWSVKAKFGRHRFPGYPCS